MGCPVGTRPHPACKILLSAVGFVWKGVVRSMDVASNRVAWQFEGGVLVPLAEVFGEGASWEFARALALRGERWVFDPSALGGRQRAVMRRRAGRLASKAAAVASGFPGVADDSPRPFLSKRSRVAFPWVWYEASVGSEERRVGSAWLFAGDLPPLRRALRNPRLRAPLFHPDAAARLLEEVPPRLLPENLAYSMGSFLDRPVSDVAPAYVWLPRWLVSSEREAFLASLAWVLMRCGSPRLSGCGSPSGRSEAFGSLPLVGGWPLPEPPLRSSSARDEALVKFLNRREWALALMACAEAADVTEGFEHG